MAGRRKDKSLPLPSNSLVASSVRYSGKAARIYQGSKQWQQDAYRHYGICGEARYAANYFGHAMSRCRLYAAFEKDNAYVEQTSGTAQAALKELFNGPGGQRQMLDAIGVHLTIAGECYLVGRSVIPDEEIGVAGVEEVDVWEIVSVLEMHRAGDKWTIKYGGSQPDVPLEDDDVVIRIWRPHPKARLEADSPFRSLLPVLSEIEWLTKHIFAQASSRLAGAGILFLPQEMSFPPPPEIDGKPAQTANDAEAMMMVLAEGMMTPLENPESPAALVPITVTAPGDVIDKARLMHFWSELDAKALEMRNDALQRFARGMDLPPEKVLGMSSNTGTGGGSSNGVSHWGAWQIDEDTIKMHIEPMLELVCNALTISFLRPVTSGTEIVESDTSKLRLRPDRSKEAIELWDRFQISTAAMLREVGFTDTDLPDAEELKTRILLKVASGSATPEQVAAAAAAFGIDLPMPETGGVPQPEPREARPAPSLDGHPNRPKTPERVPAALLFASDALVYRALERAGNRLRQMGGKPPGVPSYETHTLVAANGSTERVLEDAFSCAPQVLDGLAEVDTVVPVLESYCTSLLSTQTAHSRDRLEAWLDRTLA